MSEVPKKDRKRTSLGAGSRDQRLAKLAELFPGCVVESVDEHGQCPQAVDFDRLRRELGQSKAEEPLERFGLNWPGKRQAECAAHAPSTKVFVPKPKESVDFNTTQNLFVEGDNLDALKLLQHTHRNAVKLIYIDPPYNTGRDFVYGDGRAEVEAEYLLRSKQVSTSGRPLVDNPEAAGRFHAKWLSMLLPRLILARTLLREDGAIVVSVDDNEVGRLTCLLDEVFGRENRVVDFVWQTKAGAKGVPPRTMVTQNHEFILVYARDAKRFRFRGRPRDSSAFSNPDGDPRGPWKKDNMKSTVSGGAEYCIVEPKTGREFRARWAFSESTVGRMIDEGRVVFPIQDSGWPMQKSFINEYQNDTIPLLSLLGDRFGGTDTGAKDIAKTLGSRDIFSYPKPVKLLAFLVSQIATDPDAVVMDFFAGSGTFGEAVFAAVLDDDIERRFILVQIAEKLDPGRPAHAAAARFCDEIGKPRTIAEIAKQRIRSAGATAKKEMPGLDIGFRMLQVSDTGEPM